MNDSCEMMSKYKLRIRREKRTKITQNDTTKNREEKKKKKKKKKKRRTVEQIYTTTMDIVRSYWGCEWCWRGPTNIIDVCSESLSLYKIPFYLVQITTDTSATD